MIKTGRVREGKDIREPFYSHKIAESINYSVIQTERQVTCFDMLNESLCIETDSVIIPTLITSWFILHLQHSVYQKVRAIQDFYPLQYSSSNRSTLSSSSSSSSSNPNTNPNILKIEDVNIHDDNHPNKPEEITDIKKEKKKHKDKGKDKEGEEGRDNRFIRKPESAIVSISPTPSFSVYPTNSNNSDNINKNNPTNDNINIINNDSNKKDSTPIVPSPFVSNIPHLRNMQRTISWGSRDNKTSLISFKKYDILYIYKQYDSSK